MIYNSKPHNIEAIQFKSVDQEFPQWFQNMVTGGKASIHQDEKEGDHIILRSRKGQMEKAYIKDWICKTAHDKIYALDDLGFHNSFYTGENK